MKSIQRALSVAILVCGLLTQISCGGSSGNSSGSIRALVDGDVSSTLFDYVEKEHLSTTQFDGSQLAADYDLVIGDASILGPKRAAGDSRPIRDALDSSVPLLLFNVIDPEVESELSKITNVRFGGRHQAYLITSACNRQLTKSFGVTPFPEFDVSVSQGDFADPDAQHVFVAGKKPDYRKHGQDAVVTSQILAIYADEIAASVTSASKDGCSGDKPLEGSGRLQKSDGSGADSLVPSEIPHSTTPINFLFPVTLGGDANFSPVVQQARIGGKIEVYYDRPNNQYQIIVTQDGQVYVNSEQPLVGSKRLAEPRQTDFWTNHSLSGSSGTYAARFIPANVNQTKIVTDTVSDSFSATVGYQTAAGSATFESSHSVSHEITDWDIDNISPDPFSREWHYYASTKFNRITSAISKFNLSYQNIAEWIVNGDTTTITFTFNPARQFTYIFPEKFYTGPVPTTGVVYPAPQSMTITLPRPE